MRAGAFLGLAIALVSGPCAYAATPTDQIGADSSPSSATDAGQISVPARAGDLNAGQISASPSAPTGARQLTKAPPNVDAPAPLSTASQGRNTSIAAVKGHDRCDATPGRPAQRPECARIIENRVEEFSAPAPDQTAAKVDPDATASGLVNDIVNGGTGTVVTLPPR